MKLNRNIIRTPFKDSDLAKIAILPQWKSVYHITSVEALEKIVSDRIIRFFALSGMNDKEEIINYFKEMDPGIKKFRIKEAEFNSMIHYFQQSSFSFSTSYISQSDPKFWEEYSKGSGGVCIEINLKKLIQSLLKQNFDKLSGTKLYYGQVLYKTEVKKFFVYNRFNMVRNKVRNVVGMPLNPIINCPIFVVEEENGEKNCRQLFGCLPSFSKEYEKWSKEKEVRICFYSISNKVYQSINGKSYIPLFFDPCCIEGITLPPTASDEDKARVNKVNELLSLKG